MIAPKDHLPLVGRSVRLRGNSEPKRKECHADRPGGGRPQRSQWSRLRIPALRRPPPDPAARAFIGVASPICPRVWTDLPTRGRWSLGLQSSDVMTLPVPTAPLLWTPDVADLRLLVFVALAVGKFSQYPATLLVELSRPDI